MDFVERNATVILPLGGTLVRQQTVNDFFLDKIAVDETGVETPWKIRIQQALDLKKTQPV
jgi:hypothetical protein